MTPEERAKRAVDAMARHWSDYNYDEIVAQFRDAIKTAIEEEREDCARIADIAAGALSLNESGHLDRVEALKAVAREIRARKSKGN